MTDARMTDAPGTTFDLLATCAFGLESVVARELGELGYPARGEGTGRVAFRGDARAIVRANLWLRAADRVLIRLASFPVGAGDAGFDALYRGVQDLPWERWIATQALGTQTGQSAQIHVAARCVRSSITSEPAVQRAAKRAIVERLRVAHALSATAQLEETGPRVAVEVSLLRDTATITLDTSGVGLHKRGYRSGAIGAAQLRETLAAGLVMLSVWRPGRPLVDPFCGSGTIAIEAAMIGRNIAPGLRRTFDCEQWLMPLAPGQPANAGATSGASTATEPRLIDAMIWTAEREAARAAQRTERLDPVIHASDIDESVLRLAFANARDAGVDGDVQFIRRDVAQIASTLPHGVIVTNPPYGLRIGPGPASHPQRAGAPDDREVEAFYRAMPALFRRLPTWSFHIFTGRTDLERIFAQTASRRRKLYNSTIECCLFTFLGERPASPKVRATLDEAPLADQSSDATIDLPRSEPESTPRAPSPPRPSSPPRPPNAPASTFGGLRDRDRRDAEEFARCLAKNLRHLRRYPSRGITCYRVYERDVPAVPLIVDRYDGAFHVAEYGRPHDRSEAQQADWFDLLRRTISEVGGVAPGEVFVKEKHRQRGLTQYEKRDHAAATRVVVEGERRFEVNLSDYIDTGLFLDHRLTRAMVAERCAGRRVLNVFCYTGSFSVYAATAGATLTRSVDLSNTYLQWAGRNLSLNGVRWRAVETADAIDDLRATPGTHELIRADVPTFVREHTRDARAGRVARYDLIVCDPPTFSNSTSTMRDWEVQRDHAELLALLGELVAPGGELWFSSNFRRFKLDEVASADAGFDVRELSSRTVPPEYRNRRIHRCWRLTMVGADTARAALEERLARAAARAAANGAQSNEDATTSARDNNTHDDTAPDDHDEFDDQPDVRVIDDPDIRQHDQAQDQPEDRPDSGSTLGSP